MCLEEVGYVERVRVDGKVDSSGIGVVFEEESFRVYIDIDK